MHLAHDGLHPLEDGVGLPDGDLRVLLFDELAVRDDHGDLQGDADVGIETRHFHVEPDEVVLGAGHGHPPSYRITRGS